MRVANISARDSAERILDGATVAVTGSGGGLVEPDAVLEAIEARFLETGHPRDLTLVHALGVGDRDRRGTNRLAHRHLVRRVIGGHWTWSPNMQALAEENAIEAYSLPSGVISLLLREIGAGRPGLITRTGLGTFVDPRKQGGKVNATAQEDLVELIEIDGETYLRYKPFPVDIGIVRATAADTYGNLSTNEEPADLDIFALALAAHNSKGQVIAQVRERVAAGSLRPRDVAVPGALVDNILVCPDQAQTYRGGYDMALAGLERSPAGTALINAGTGIRRIIAQRAAEELVPGSTVNFGFGISAGVAGVIAERGETERYWTTIEQGIHGGVMETGDLFGMALNPMAILPATEQFDLYHGGGLDTAFLGMAELDGEGNVNVSHLGGQIVGPGGFIDITQHARKVVFCGTFDAKDSKIEIVEGGLRVRRPGRIQKLVSKVSAVTFSGPEARRRGQEVVYVTERAVFRLAAGGVELIEYVAGVDVERDILSCMGFRPILRNPKPMRPEYFLS